MHKYVFTILVDKWMTVVGFDTEMEDGPKMKIKNQIIDQFLKYL